MTVDELRIEFPGLFKPLCCQTLAEAERHADTVSASLGLGVRITENMGDGGLRTLEYSDRSGLLRFRVAIERHREGHREPCWFFRCSAERTDLGLRVEGSKTLQPNPLAFEKEAKEMVRRLRRVTTGPRRRLTGSLMKWDSVSGKGWLECIPGAWVALSVEDIPSSERPFLRRLSQFTFELGKSADGEVRAVNVHRKASADRSA